MTGRDNVWQDLRTICVWKEHPEDFYIFMEKFYEKCMHSGKDYEKDMTKCSEEVIKSDKVLDLQ